MGLEGVTRVLIDTEKEEEGLGAIAAYIYKYISIPS